MGLLVWPCEGILGREREEKHPLRLLWGHERGKTWTQCYQSMLYYFHSLHKATKKVHTVGPTSLITFLPQNPRREVERIMRYLDLSVSDEIISRIVELTSFKNMKENPMANYSCIPAPVFDQTISPFMRKGAAVCSRCHPETRGSLKMIKSRRSKLNKIKWNAIM